MWGYNNIQIREGDEYKAAFTTPKGMFEPTVMFFGLNNSPATFQGFMNTIFKALVDTGKVQIYMDDILVMTKGTKQEHLEVLKETLKVLLENKLCVRPTKCEFFKHKIEALGLVLSEGQVEMDPIKINGVKEWKAPTKVKEVQSFLGFCNFYHRFIKNFSELAKPLHAFTHKDTKWKWEEEENQAFEGLKMSVTSEPVLKQPNGELPF